MAVLKASEARNILDELIDETAASHHPVLIIGTRRNAVLLSEDDWRSIQETLHLLSIPGMRKSIIDGLNTPVSECTEAIEW